MSNFATTSDTSKQPVGSLDCQQSHSPTEPSPITYSPVVTMRRDAHISSRMRGSFTHKSPTDRPQRQSGSCKDYSLPSGRWLQRQRQTLQEDTEATFSPTINPTSALITAQIPETSQDRLLRPRQKITAYADDDESSHKDARVQHTGGARAAGSLERRMDAWAARREAKLHDARFVRDEALQRECTFKPRVTARTSVLRKDKSTPVFNPAIGESSEDACSRPTPDDVAVLQNALEALMEAEGASRRIRAVLTEDARVRSALSLVQFSHRNHFEVRWAHKNMPTVEELQPVLESLISCRNYLSSLEDAHDSYSCRQQAIYEGILSCATSIRSSNEDSSVRGFRETQPLQMLVSTVRDAVQDRLERQARRAVEEQERVLLLHEARMQTIPVSSSTEETPAERAEREADEREAEELAAGRQEYEDLTILIGNLERKRTRTRQQNAELADRIQKLQRETKEMMFFVGSRQRHVRDAAAFLLR